MSMTALVVLTMIVPVAAPAAALASAVTGSGGAPEAAPAGTEESDEQRVQMRLHPRRDSCSQGHRLEGSPGEDHGWCGGQNQGAGNQLTYMLSGDYPVKSAYTAQTGEAVPFTLDGTGSVTGTLRTYSQSFTDFGLGPAAGQATIDITLTAVVAGEERVLLDVSASYLVEPTTIDYDVALSGDIPDELDRQEVSALELTVGIRGTTFWYHGDVRHTDASHLDVPIILDEDT